MSCRYTPSAGKTPLDRSGAAWARHLASGCRDCASFVGRNRSEADVTPALVSVADDALLGSLADPEALTMQVLTMFDTASSSVAAVEDDSSGEFSRRQLLPAANLLLKRAFSLRFSSLKEYEEKTRRAMELAEAFEPKGRFERELKNDTLARVHLQMANYCRLSCQLQASSYHLRAAEQLAKEGYENPETTWGLLHFEADLLYMQAEDSAGVKALQLARNVASEAGLTQLALFSAAMISARKTLDSSESAEAELNRLDEVLADLRDPIAITVVRINRALALSSTGAPGQMVDMALVEASPSKETAPYLFIAFLIASCRVRLDRGSFEEAAALAKTAVNLAAEAGHPRYLVESMLILSESMANGRAWPEAAKLAAESARLAADMSLTALFVEAIQLCAGALARGTVDPLAIEGLRALLSPPRKSP